MTQPSDARRIKRRLGKPFLLRRRENPYLPFQYIAGSGVWLCQEEFERITKTCLKNGEKILVQLVEVRR